MEVLKCTTCGKEFIHITKVSVHRGFDIVKVTKNKIKRVRCRNMSRGAAVEIEWKGECGHMGHYILHYCKGDTTVYNESLSPDLSIEDIFSD